MALPDGYTDVPPGKIAAVVTYLEMVSAPQPRAVPPLDGISVRAVAAPDTDWYRELFVRVGAEDWLWSSRLEIDVESLSSIIGDPDVEIYALTRNGRDEGLLELDFRKDGECELAFFGLTRDLIGRGAGRYLMNQAIERAWSRPIRRFWLHTCTHDHPGAVAFYMRSGFRPYHLQVEIADDPRLAGLIPETAAPNIPILRP